VPRSPFPKTVLLAASLTVSCGAGPTGRQTTASNTRGEDPWLTGEPCSPETPVDPSPQIEVLAAGSGEPIATGMTVRVHYVASLADGTVLHDSHDGNLPSDVVLGSTKTFCGFERALLGMRPGERRRASVPWSLAFGESGRPPEIPPRTDLVLVIDLYVPADAALQNGAPPPRPGGAGRRR
jgi:peptidylprolyl isomerase